MKFTPNPEQLAELAKQPAVREAMMAKAQEVADLCVENSRFRRYNPTCKVDSGQRDASGRFVTGGTLKVIRTEPFASIDEWGSKNGPPSAALRRAVQTAGLRFEESPKP